jgi:putative transposase
MLIGTARPDVPACMGFPAARRTKPHPASPVKRLNREIKRRTGVVGIFPDETTITRLIGAILMKHSEDWAVRRARCMTLEAMAPVSDGHTVMLPAVPGA